MTPSLPDLTRTFARIGCLSFGGPAAQIALMHRVLVDERKWLSEKDYLSALSFCMLLPGPEAMQLATWAGWRLHGTAGGLIAGGLFVLPGALVVLILSMAYAAWGSLPLMQALFLGVQAAVIAIVIEALIRVARRALRGRAAYVIAGLAFLGLFVMNLPFPVIILSAGLWGLFTARGTPAALPPVTAPRTPQTLVLWLAVWLVPLGLLWLQGGILFDIGWFFSKLAVLTFGGAYAVLAWMTQEVVQVQGWLTTSQMMAGLGLAETTPGPLILVNEFVGFMAGYGASGWGLGIAAALVTLWMTFVPCFLFIFVAAPYMARVTADPRLAGALNAIMAAVVGVIANLSLWFALHLLFGTLTPQSLGPMQLTVPDLASLNLTALALAAVSALLLLGFHRPLWQVLLASALLSVAISAA
ncbi:chromate efflux transporter [Pseudorhodobacter sp. MZDSW-24AT]|uniref:chromate efflux transporter n=1 Tax=Pseudorhodobacter sp. MZDSW-24AT TaxID=2052957 RepID=UPI000C1E43F4|nr:chromate efflux transporter [Pseudorhodobacter sp. MZDSW-24AT]PJF10479.1 chromate transporter [Pseudorhodobacter sp. MZDSW-24AT]